MTLLLEDTPETSDLLVELINVSFPKNTPFSFDEQIRRINYIKDTLDALKEELDINPASFSKRKSPELPLFTHYSYQMEDGFYKDADDLPPFLGQNSYATDLGIPHASWEEEEDEEDNLSEYSDPPSSFQEFKSLCSVGFEDIFPKETEYDFTHVYEEGLYSVTIPNYNYSVEYFSDHGWIFNGICFDSFKTIVREIRTEMDCILSTPFS